VNFRDPKVYLHALQYRSANLLLQSADRLQDQVGAGKDVFTAWNDRFSYLTFFQRTYLLIMRSQVFFLQSLAKSYMEFVLVSKFVDYVEEVCV